MVREPLTPEAIAAGWALGMFVGCAIPFGLQLVVSVPLALMMRVSKVGATVGTLVTNPVTIFFIYPAQTWFVNRLLFNGSLSFDRLMQVEWTWEAVRRLGAEAMASFCALANESTSAMRLSPATAASTTEPSFRAST